MRTTRTLLAPALLIVAACTPATPPKPPEPVKTEPAKTEPVKTATLAAEKPAEMGDAADTGGKSGISGVVSFVGAAPAPRKLDMSKDKACTKQAGDTAVRDVDVKDGKLKGVFVYVKSGLPDGQKFPARAESVLLDQKGCLYSPTMMGIQVGQTLEVLNSDPFLHNIHALAKVGEFNQGMPKQGQRIEKKFKKPQVPVVVKCEVHPWMQAWIGVVDHPFFAVTDDAGAFAIEGVPAGTYEVELFHPTLGAKTEKVTVSDGRAAPIMTAFKAG